MQTRHSVKVSASTSNLGPGFDMLGLCLDLYLHVDLELGPAADTKRSHRHTLHLEQEAEGLSNQDDNLLCRAFDRGLKTLGVSTELTWAWRVRSEIPVARGLGSSGAATAAGLLLACQVAERDPKLELNRLIRLGTEIEGHPDNVVASLVDGCTLTLQTEGDFHIVRPSIHPDLGFAVAWGQTPMPTALGRSLLPAQVSFDAALDQPRRTVALLEGLRLGSRELLQHAATEHLHVHARLPHIQGGAEALAEARQAGAHLATISGSGSSLIAIGPKDKAQPIADAMGRVLNKADGPAKARAVLPIGC